VRITTGFLALALTLAAIPGAVDLEAHHAFTAEFDASQPIQLRGVVARVELINPHSWIHMDVTGDDGTVTRWMIEGGTPNTLFRRGVTRDSLPVGEEILVDGYRALDRSNKANGRDVTFPDGRKIFLSGSSAQEQPQP
jgi:hypothetical protein